MRCKDLGIIPPESWRQKQWGASKSQMEFRILDLQRIEHELRTKIARLEAKLAALTPQENSGKVLDS